MSDKTTKPFDDLEAEYDQKRKDLLVKVSTSFVDTMKQAATAFADIPADKQHEVLKQDSVTEILTKLGLKLKKRGKRKPMTKEAKDKIRAAAKARWAKKKGK